MEQLGPSVQTHRRIGLELQRLVVELERIIRILETFVDLLWRMCESGSACTFGKHGRDPISNVCLLKVPFWTLDDFQIERGPMTIEHLRSASLWE
jgi:hypothetical protein